MYLRNTSCSDERDDLFPVAAEPVRKLRRDDELFEIASGIASVQLSTHLSIASKNFSCSSSLHLSRGLVILYGLRDLPEAADRITKLVLQ